MPISTPEGRRCPDISADTDFSFGIYEISTYYCKKLIRYTRCKAWLFGRASW
jgi:hypothetical protein